MLLYIAEDIDPLVKEFFVAWPAGQLVETADQSRVSAAYYLAQAIQNKCEHYDGLVAKAWNDAEQQKMMKDVPISVEFDKRAAFYLTRVLLIGQATRRSRRISGETP